MRWHKIPTITLLGSLLCGCSAYTQTTSGQDWLSGYSPVQVATGPDDIDARVRQAGAIEPTLHFPARIGIARVGQVNWQARLVPIPETEAAVWLSARDRLGRDFGDFVPVSPLVAAMVEPGIGADANTRPAAMRHLMDSIRLAAARQHLDAVLIYEVDATADQKSNPLHYADWTVIGAFVVPSQTVKAVGVAQAMLIDVRNGYPYGQVTSTTDDKTLAAVFYSGEAKTALREKVGDAAVAKLAGESEGMIRKLKVELDARRQ